MPLVARAAAAKGLSYRPVNDGDSAFMEALYLSTRSEEVAATGWPAELQEQFLRQQAGFQLSHYRLHHADAHWLIIERDRRAVGRLILRETAEDYHIIDIAMTPESRGCGFGTAILSDLIADARSAAKTVTIHVEKANPAMTLYRRLGFEKIEDRGVYDLMACAAQASSA